MTEVIITNIYLFILAIVLAILEIQIEGPNGWAQNLPTWRPKNNNWYIKFYRQMMSGREPTGYHITIFTFVLLILHIPYVFGLPLIPYYWLQTLSFFFMFVVLWDFLWFVLNPHHPLKTFSKKHIWWHKKWLGNVPTDYYMAILLSLVVLSPIAWYYDQTNIWMWWLINIGLFAAGTLIVIIFTLFVLKIDNWVKK